MTMREAKALGRRIDGRARQYRLRLGIPWTEFWRNPLLAVIEARASRCIDVLRETADYDAEDDFRRSLDDCYAAVKARVAAGGEGWNG